VTKAASAIEILAPVVGVGARVVVAVVGGVVVVVVVVVADVAVAARSFNKFLC